MVQVERRKLAPHHSRALWGCGVLLRLGIVAGDCLGSLQSGCPAWMPSTGQLRAVRRAGRCSAASVLWGQLCPVPTHSRGLAEHHGTVWASYSTL